MSTEVAQVTAIKEFVNKADVQSLIQDVMKDKAKEFASNLIQLAANNKLLATSEPNSVMQAALSAAISGLSINPNFGHAYIIPYGKQAQLQIGWKGFYQLAVRSGLYKKLTADKVHEGELVSNNPMDGPVFNWAAKKSDVVIGYFAHYELNTGLIKTIYMTVDALTKHAKKYSQTFKSGGGVWSTDFESMAKKTMYRQLLTKYAPFSDDLQRAIIADQSVVTDAVKNEVIYIDNEQPKEAEIMDEEIYALLEEHGHKLSEEHLGIAREIVKTKDKTRYAKLRANLLK